MKSKPEFPTLEPRIDSAACAHISKTFYPRLPYSRTDKIKFDVNPRIDFSVQSFQKDFLKKETFEIIPQLWLELQKN